MICECCTKLFDDVEDYTNHIAVHHISRTKCALCPGNVFSETTFACVQLRRLHARCHLGISAFLGSVSYVSLLPGERPFQCSECGKKFARQAGLTRHLKSHDIWQQGRLQVRLMLVMTFVAIAAVIRGTALHHMSKREILAPSKIKVRSNILLSLLDP